MKANTESAFLETEGTRSERASEHYSGTIPTRKHISHPESRGPSADNAPRGTAGDSTRAYSQSEVAQLLRAADESRQSRSLDGPGTPQVVTSEAPVVIGESTRTYSAEEVARLAQSTPGLVTALAAPDLPEPMEEPTRPLRLGRIAPIKEVPAPVSASDESTTLLSNRRVSERRAERRNSGVAAPNRSKVGLFAIGFLLASMGGGAAWLLLAPSHWLPRSWHLVKAPGPKDPAIVDQAMNRVNLSIEIEPPCAKLLLDGAILSNPLRASYRASGALHEIRGEAPGYASRTVTIPFDRDAVVVLALAKMPPPD